MLGSPEVDDLTDIEQAILRACLNEYDIESDGGDTSGADELLERQHQSKPPKKCLSKFASFPCAVSPLRDDYEIETALRRIFSEDSVQSACFCSISLPTPLKLVSALKGSREKQGLPLKELTLTWAPDVYDPPPTSVLHTVRGKSQQKSKKNDKKKNGKKGRKGNNSSRGSNRGSGGGKDNKQFRRGGGISDRHYKPLAVQDRVINASGNLDGFNTGSSSEPFCESSSLKKSHRGELDYLFNTK